MFLRASASLVLVCGMCCVHGGCSRSIGVDAAGAPSATAPPRESAAADVQQQASASPVSVEPAKASSVADAVPPRDPALAAVPLVTAIPPATLVSSVRAAGHPERRSLTFLPAAFDRASYVRDPTAYLSVVEPARVFQSADPAPGVWALRPAGSAERVVATGNRLALAVLAPPHAPVSWHCAEGGVFAASTLNSVTVQADDAGLAQAIYIATPGTTGDATVLVASPICSGRVTFTIHIAE